MSNLSILKRRSGNTLYRRRLLAPLTVLLVWTPVAALAAAHAWGFLLLTQGAGPSLLENSASNASRIDVPPLVNGWKFAVIGDLGKRYEIFLRALDEMKRSDVRFIVITGDSVYRKTEEQYQYLQLKIARSGFARPLLAAIGNEDVVKRGDYRWFRQYLSNEGSQTASAPGFFSFDARHVERFAFMVPSRPPFGAMFIVFDNAFGPPSNEQLDWMERLLRRYRGTVQYAFLVAHQPIVRVSRRIQTVSSDELLLAEERPLKGPAADTRAGQPGDGFIRVDPASKESPNVPLPVVGKREADLPELLLPEYRRLYDLLQRNQISAVFSGHLHGYRRYQLGPSLHIVTGGGGARLQYPDAMHHYLEVKVGKDGVSVRPQRISGEISFEAKVEQILIAEVFFFFRNNPWLYCAALAWIIAAAWITLICGARRSPR